MYIEFYLSHWPDHASELTQALDEWSLQYQIPYRSKTVKNKKRITFNEDKFYNFFVLTWPAKKHHEFWTNYRVITDLNNKI